MISIHAFRVRATVLLRAHGSGISSGTIYFAQFTCLPNLSIGPNDEQLRGQWLGGHFCQNYVFPPFLWSLAVSCHVLSMPVVMWLVIAGGRSPTWADRVSWRGRSLCPFGTKLRSAFWNIFDKFPLAGARMTSSRLIVREQPERIALGASLAGSSVGPSSLLGRATRRASMRPLLHRPATTD